MFGYVLPDKNYLYMKDYALYQGVYCGICKATKQKFGNLARIATNYDSIFLAVLVHNLCNIDFVFTKQRCILHPLKKKNMALPDELSRRIGVLNVLLLYHKLNDDVVDSGQFKYRAGRRFLRIAYRKAQGYEPTMDTIITEEYLRLRELEKQGCDSIDRVSDCFGRMMERLCRELISSEKSSEAYQRVCYNTGRWIYLIDALDDLEKDNKNGNYNVFLAAFKDFTGRESFLEKHREEIEFSLLSTVGAIETSASELTYHFNADLIDNITRRGLSVRTKLLMENNDTCKKIRI